MTGFEFVAMQECAQGNERVGTEWLATRTFGPETTIEQVVEWADSLGCPLGRLMIARNKAPEANR